jgi:hypothetical protein
MDAGEPECRAGGYTAIRAWGVGPTVAALELAKRCQAGGCLGSECAQGSWRVRFSEIRGHFRHEEFFIKNSQLS